MARGYPGAFGRKVNALYVWLPLRVALPRAVPRLPPAAARCCTSTCSCCCSFSVSLAFFNHAQIDASVPLVYPPLLYLLARMLRCGRRCAAAARRGRAAAPARAGAAGWPSAWSSCVGFRVGAERDRLERDRRRLRGRDRRRPARPRQAAVRQLPEATTNTATPTGRSTTRPTCPFEQAFAVERHAGTTCPPRTRAAIFFDLLVRRPAVPARPARARARRSASRSPTPGPRSRSRSSRSKQHQRHARRARSCCCALLAAATARLARGARSVGAGRADEVRAARARAAAAPPTADARAARSRGRRVRAGDSCVAGGDRLVPVLAYGALRDVLRPHVRLPGRAAARRSRSGACTAGTTARSTSCRSRGVVLALAARVRAAPARRRRPRRRCAAAC